MVLAAAEEDLGGAIAIDVDDAPRQHGEGRGVVPMREVERRVVKGGYQRVFDVPIVRLAVGLVIEHSEHADDEHSQGDE